MIYYIFMKVKKSLFVAKSNTQYLFSLNEILEFSRSCYASKFCSRFCDWVPVHESVTRQNKRGDAIGLTRWGPSVNLSPGILSDLKHWRGRPTNNEAISTTGLRVGARQALYYQQRSLFRALLTLHHWLVVSTGALVRPNPAFPHIVSWWSQWEMINEASVSLTLGSKTLLIIPPLPI